MVARSMRERMIRRSCSARRRGSIAVHFVIQSKSARNQFLFPHPQRKAFDQRLGVSIVTFPHQPEPETFYMALAVGTKAPDFSLATKTADGPKQIKLSDNFGKQNTLLLFFPMAFTGTCTQEMCSLSPELPNYTGMNAAVYGISGDNPFPQEAWA